MKCLSLSLMSVLILAVGTPQAGGQAILNRVEQFVRDQVGAVAGAIPSEPGYLGLIGDDTKDPGQGVRVLDVVAGGPAAQGDIRVGDLITRINGQRVQVMDDMAKALEGKPAGARLTMTIERSGSEAEKSVTLGRRAPAIAPSGEAIPTPAVDTPQPTPSPQRLGVRAVPVTEASRVRNNLPKSTGAEVMSVTTGSPAERAGIPLRSIITAIDDTPINSPEELAAVVRASPSSKVSVTYIFDGQAMRRDVSLAGVPAIARRAELRSKLPLPPQDTDMSEPAPSAESSADQRVIALEQRVMGLETQLKEVIAELRRMKTPAPPKPGLADPATTDSTEDKILELGPANP